MRAVRFGLAVAVLLGGMVACASPAAWQRPGTASDQAAFDLQDCRSEARARMASDLYYARERADYDARQADRIGQADGTAVAERWQELRERRNRGDLVEDCMTRKGYRLAPVGDSAA